MVLRNVGLKNSQLLLDADICNIPNLSAEYIFMPNYNGGKHNRYSFWKPSLGFRYQYTKLNSDLYHNEDAPGSISSSFKLQRHSIRLRASSNWRSSILGFGVHFDYTRTYNPEEEIDQIEVLDIADKGFKDRWYIYPYISFEHNSYNERYYPTKGWKMNFNLKYVNGINIEDITASEFLTAYMHTESVISILKNHLSFYMGFTAASVFFQDKMYIPLAYRYFLGGQSVLPSWNIISFPGLPLTCADGMQLWNVTLNIQAKIIKNFYVSLRGGIGEAENNFEELFEIKNLLYGGNIGISYNTPIGPVGISFQTSNRMRFGVFLNVFYWY
jgi:outer membrane translocation and assembly module TamA